MAEQQTLAHFLADWLNTIRPTIKLRTWTHYAEYVNTHTIPTLGTVRLAKLNAQQIQALYAAKLEEGLSPTTVHHLHAVLHRALHQAMRWGLVPRNVCDLVDAPRMAAHDMQVLTPPQVKTLLEVARGDRWEALYVLAVTSGMRMGELLALKWGDVDLDRAYLQVRGNLQRTAEGLVIGTPKTAKSRRKVALTTMAVEALRQHRVRQLEERLRLGEARGDGNDADLVFPNGTGKPMEGTDLLRTQFYPLLSRAGLPHVRFHDLRHTAATLCCWNASPPRL